MRARSAAAPKVHGSPGWGPVENQLSCPPFDHACEYIITGDRTSLTHPHFPMRQITIDNIAVDDLSECYVIAEIGHNHQGSVDKAKEMFLEAQRAGAHAVKLQKRDNRTLYTEE